MLFGSQPELVASQILSPFPMCHFGSFQLFIRIPASKRLPGDHLDERRTKV